MRIPDNPRVLVVGSGAREHAVLRTLAQSQRRPVLFAAPGNAGMAAETTCLPVAVDDVVGLVQAARDIAADLVVVGPELPLARGMVDACQAAGIRVFGPTQAAAQLEASKAFAKAVMAEAGVPTASHQTFTDAAAAKAYIQQQGAPIVVKADGLAAGKGVVVAQTVAEACAAVDDMMLQGRFGASGQTVVIEQCLVGEEVSMMYFVDHETVAPMLPARDYKRVGEGDTGGNTGGMGAFAPVPELHHPAFVERVTNTIVQPLLAALKRRGIVYRGVLYAGLMVTADGPYVIEFNCRFGDPETEVVLPLLASDLLDILWAVTEDQLANVAVRWREEKAICVVLAAPGYPDAPQTGQAIVWPADGLTQAGAGGLALVYHAGSREVDGVLQTAGGRVLVCTGVARSFALARKIAYEAADAIYFDGKYLRRDIALHLDAAD